MPTLTQASTSSSFPSQRNSDGSAEPGAICLGDLQEGAAAASLGSEAVSGGGSFGTPDVPTAWHPPEQGILLFWKLGPPLLPLSYPLQHELISRAHWARHATDLWHTVQAGARGAERQAGGREKPKAPRPPAQATALGSHWEGHKLGRRPGLLRGGEKSRAVAWPAPHRPGR